MVTVRSISTPDKHTHFLDRDDLPDIEYCTLKSQRNVEIYKSNSLHSEETTGKVVIFTHNSIDNMSHTAWSEIFKIARLYQQTDQDDHESLPVAKKFYFTSNSNVMQLFECLRSYSHLDDSQISIVLFQTAGTTPRCIQTLAKLESNVKFSVVLQDPDWTVNIHTYAKNGITLFTPFKKMQKFTSFNKTSASIDKTTLDKMKFDDKVELYKSCQDQTIFKNALSSLSDNNITIKDDINEHVYLPAGSAEIFDLSSIINESVSMPEQNSVIDNVNYAFYAGSYKEERVKPLIEMIKYTFYKTNMNIIIAGSMSSALTDSNRYELGIDIIKSNRFKTIDHLQASAIAKYTQRASVIYFVPDTIITNLETDYHRYFEMGMSDANIFTCLPSKSIYDKVDSQLLESGADLVKQVHLQSSYDKSESSIDDKDDVEKPLNAMYYHFDKFAYIDAMSEKINKKALLDILSKFV